MFDAAGKRVFQYRPELKKEFVRKIMSLVDKDSLCNQYLTLAEVMNDK